MSQEDVTTPDQLKVRLSNEQKTWLRTQCMSLLKEAEDVEDAIQYVGDVVRDMVDKWEDLEVNWDLLRDLVVNELKALHVS